MDMTVLDNEKIQAVVAISGAIIIVSITVFTIRRIIKKRRVSRHIQFVHCTSCRWKGNVSRYAGRCPQCNQPLGDQKARFK
jgi:hypothetical protein